MPYTPDETLARSIIEPYVSKTLTRKLSHTLQLSISTILRQRTKAMLTFGPQEIARIAERENLTSEQIAAVLHGAGGVCVDSQGVADAWDLDLSTAPDFLGDSRARIATEIRMLLHASRDGMRNKRLDTTKVTFAMHSDGGYYNEAFGMIRALNLLGYGHLGGNLDYNDPLNLQTWFRALQDDVLAEEGFNGSNVCLYCLDRYGKDSNGRKESA